MTFRRIRLYLSIARLLMGLIAALLAALAAFLSSVYWGLNVISFVNDFHL